MRTPRKRIDCFPPRFTVIITENEAGARFFNDLVTLPFGDRQRYANLERTRTLSRFVFELGLLQCPKAVGKVILCSDDDRKCIDAIRTHPVHAGEIALSTSDAKSTRSDRPKKPTRLFLNYAAQMALRFVLFCLGAAAFILAPSQISISESFGIKGGLDLIDIVFIAISADALTKFFPTAKLSMGSLKQYGEFHVPTARMFQGGRDGVVAYVRETIAQGRIAVERIPAELPTQVRTAWEETRAGALDSLRVLLRSIDFLRIIPFKAEQLTASEDARNQIRQDRFREIMPVGIFWIVFNLVIGGFLACMGWLNELTVLIWVLFYFLFDMVCVVLWCPIQLLLMRNRCCTTCQIFNWDAFMAVTPLLFISLNLQTAWFAWPLLTLGLIVLIRWELAFARYPERFDERTNASLSCANCKDKLCHIREPLFRSLPEIPSLAKPATPLITDEIIFRKSGSAPQEPTQNAEDAQAEA